jgi:hypothetical protein
MTNPLQRDPITAHYRAVDTVAEIAPPPKDWLALRARLEAFTATDTPIREKLDPAPNITLHSVVRCRSGPAARLASE